MTAMPQSQLNVTLSHNHALASHVCSIFHYFHHLCMRLIKCQVLPSPQLGMGYTLLDDNTDRKLGKSPIYGQLLND